MLDKMYDEDLDFALAMLLENNKSRNTLSRNKMKKRFWPPIGGIILGLLPHLFVALVVALPCLLIWWCGRGANFAS